MRRKVQDSILLVCVSLVPIVASAVMVVLLKGRAVAAGLPGLLPRIGLVAGLIAAGLYERHLSHVSRSKEAGSADGV